MNRDANYQEAKERVKISYFTEQGHDINGIIHIGAHNGYEVEYYLKMGIENIICFEPWEQAVNQLREKYSEAIKDGKVMVFPLAVGSRDGYSYLNITGGDGQGSSFLELKTKDKSKPYYQEVVNEQVCKVVKFTTWLAKNRSINLANYDCLVIDAQGMELNVLKGMGVYLKEFKYLNIECSLEPIYHGEAPAKTIIRFLREMGFAQSTPAEEHNDIMFTRFDLM